MENQKAIEVLIQCAQLAQKGGLLSLQDAVIVAQAIETLTPKKDELSNEQ